MGLWQLQMIEAGTEKELLLIQRIGQQGRSKGLKRLLLLPLQIANQMNFCRHQRIAKLQGQALVNHQKDRMDQMILSFALGRLLAWALGAYLWLLLQQLCLCW